VEIKAYAPLVLALTACVPATRYEEAQSAAQVEAEGRRRAALELQNSQQRVAELEASLQARESEIDARQSALDEQQLASSIAEKERDENASLVEQLRGELSRTGEHLKSYADEKARLEKELSSAQEAAATPPAKPEVDPPGTEIPPPPAAEPAPAPAPAAPPAAPPKATADLGALARGVSAALAAVGLDQKVKVATKADAVELTIGESVLFEDDSAALRPGLMPLFVAAARLASTDPSLSGSLREASHDSKMSPTLGDERRAQLAATLKQHGLDGRIRLEPLDEPVSGAPKTYVLSLRSAGGGKG
jgi:flagellar motor protein MotB